ncbi:fibronectin type III domain-containing protein [Flavobacterium chuncheonense]|uniref:Fibronectin type III domain-containing protein n=1 Tax=Flavobacterium chuncheonense TaxID=2026653 RepID=A0ABW5YLT4_9FLAO
MKKLLLVFLSLFAFASYGQALFEDFEGTATPDLATGDWALDSGTWKFFDNGVGSNNTVQITTFGSLVCQDTRAAYLNRETVAAGQFSIDWLVTPQVTIPANGQIRFYGRSTQSGEQGSVYKVYISTTSQTDVTSFTLLATYNELDFPNGPCQQEFILLDAYPAGTQAYFAFVHENNNGDRWVLDNVKVDQQCFPPTNLQAAPAATSATLTWSYAGPATQFEIEYGPIGFTPGTGTFISPVSSPYPLNPPLLPLTSYTYYVRALCDVDNPSPWSDPRTFTTTELPPGCGGNFSDSGGASGNYGNNQNIVTVLCPDTTGDVVTVSFSSFNTQAGDILYVYNGDNTGATLLGSYSGANTPPSFTSSAANGCLTFHFVSNATGVAAGWTSNISCGPPPACPMPIAVTVTGANSSSATVSWIDPTGGTGPYDIYWVPTGSPAPTASSVPNASSVPGYSYLIPGLNSNSPYTVYVRTTCDATNGVISDWTFPTNFTTTPNYCAGDHFYDTGGATGNYGNNENIFWTICPETTGDVVTAIFNSFATATGDILTVYNGNNTSAPVLGTYQGTNLPPVFTSSTGCLTFQFTSTASANQAGWDASIFCTPPPTCALPTALSVVSISDDSVEVTWTDNNTTPPAGGWLVVVQPVGTGYPGAGAVTIPATSNPFTINNLNPNTQYEFWVRADCGNGDNSFWNGPINFTTLFAGCGSSEPAGNDAPNATPVCTVDGYCGNTSGSYTVNTWPELSTAFCGSIENNSFLTFQASCTTVTLDVLVGNCTNGSGVQFFLFSANTIGSGPVSSIACYSPMNPGTNALTFNGLAPGQTYILMIDGFAGAICDYSVTVTSPGCTSTGVQVTASNPVDPTEDFTEDDEAGATTICLGESLNLTASGSNGVYTWTASDPNSIAVTANDVVLFTPGAPGVYTVTASTNDPASICNTSDTYTITVLDVIQPTFVNPSPICVGAANIPLATTDTNGVTGTWELVTDATTTPVTTVPATQIDATVAGTYTYVFNPDPVTFACSPQFTMVVDILGTCDFNVLGTAVNIETCETAVNGDYFNVTGGTIAPPANVYTNNDFGTYVQNSGNLVLNGGQLVSFENTASTVCSANMYYRVYAAGSTPGAFTTLPLTFVEACSGGTFTNGNSCNAGDQIWADITSTNLDLTTFTPGDYVIEVYYDLVGDDGSGTACGTTILVNNNNNNFIATFAIQGTPSFTWQDEQCGSSNAVITVSGFNPGDVYSVTFDDNDVPTGPMNIQANFNGDININGLDAGVYDNFVFTINGCDILAPAPITIVDFSPSVTGITSNSPICFEEDAVFTIQASAGFDIDYTINGSTVVETVTVDASGIATITITAPAVGTVDLALLNIYNSVCNITVTDTHSVIVNPLPTATILAASPFACIGSDAVFTINGTPGASVTYTQNGTPGAAPIVLDAAGTATLTVPTTVNMQIILGDVTDATTGCTDAVFSQIANVAIVDIPLPETTNTDPTCATPQGSIEVTSPLIAQLNYPGDLFISEVTDSQPGSLTYVEIYNGTGSSVDLSNYKVKVYVNGGATALCDLPLTGTLAHDDVVVVKIGSSANEGGVVPDLEFTACSGVNNNDKIALATSADVEIDVWGTPDGTPFTPPFGPYGIGYNYQRVTIGTTLPSINWEPADWVAVDWGNPTSAEDYSSVGVYTLFVASYEYILNDGTADTVQTNPIFSGLAAGNYTLVAHDTITNCYSQPLSITLSNSNTVDPVTAFTYVTPVCNDNANLLPDTSAPNFAVGGEFTSTTGLVIDIATGEIDVVNSTPGTYTVTYTVLPDVANCINGASSTFVVVITASTPATFNAIALCEGDTNSALPVTSIEGFTGTWDVSSIDTSVAGTYTYTFTPDQGQCASVGTLEVTIIAKDIVTFDGVEICVGAEVEFPIESVEGHQLTGTWSPSTIDTSLNGSTTYTFTPDDICYATSTFIVTTKGCQIQKGISPNYDGLNDNFDLSAFNVSKLEIFNRYGRIVYSKNNYVNEWNGKADNGKELPDATYYYVIHFNDMPSKTGWIYINREH